MEKQNEGRCYTLLSSKEEKREPMELLLRVWMKGFKVEISHPKRRVREMNKRVKRV